MAPTSSLVSKIKVQLKLAISRLRMVQQKDTAIAKQQRRAMAVLLEACGLKQQGKIESARIRVENIIRSDITTELHEILELYCELLLARAGLLDSATSKETGGCDPGLEEAIKSLIYAAPRTDIKELHQARLLLVEKFGKEFALDAVENRDGKVAERVVSKLRMDAGGAPDETLVTGYLAEIARTYGVDWPPREKKEEQDDGEGGDDDNGEDDQPGSGGRQANEAVNEKKTLEAPLTTATTMTTKAAAEDELRRATPPQRDLGPRSPVSVAPPSPSIDNISPRVKLPAPPELKPGAKMTGAKKGTTTTSAATGESEVKEGEGAKAKAGTKGTGGAVVGGKIPDVDDLQRRFAELKRRI